MSVDVVVASADFHHRGTFSAVSEYLVLEPTQKCVAIEKVAWHKMPTRICHAEFLTVFLYISTNVLLITVVAKIQLVNCALHNYYVLLRHTRTINRIKHLNFYLTKLIHVRPNVHQNFSHTERRISVSSPSSQVCTEESVQRCRLNFLIDLLLHKESRNFVRHSSTHHFFSSTTISQFCFRELFFYIVKLIN